MKLIKLKQGSPEWLEFRKYHIGGSDISAITGNNPWKDALYLWKGKGKNKQEEYINKSMKAGMEKEEEARNFYIFDSGINVTPEVCQFDLWDIAISSLDGLSDDRESFVEIKCPTNLRLLEMALSEEIPSYYLDQIQWGLMITDCAFCDFLVYIDNNNNKTIRIFPDIAYQQKLLDEAIIFWKYVELNTEPPVKDPINLIEDENDNKLAEEIKKWEELEKKAKDELFKIKSSLKEKYKDQKKYIFSNAKIKMCWREGATTIDWKAYRKDNKILEISLKPYSRKSENSCVFTIVE